MEILLEDCDKSEYAENLVNYLDYILLGSAGYWDGELHLFTDMVTGKRPQRTSEDEFYNRMFLRISQAAVSANQQLYTNEPEPGWGWETEAEAWPGMDWGTSLPCGFVHAKFYAMHLISTMTDTRRRRSEYQPASLP